MRICAANLNQTPLDFDGNLERITKAITEAKEAKADIICLPELAITSYDAEDTFFWPETYQRALASLEKIVPIIDDELACIGLPIDYSGCRYNCIALINNKKVIAIVPKQHLANDGVYYEQRWFLPWSAGLVDSIKVLGQTVPFGDLTINYKGVHIGLEICEDAWGSKRKMFDLKKRGVQLIINPSASHFAIGKEQARLNLIQEALDNGISYCFVNQLGNCAGRLIYDGDAIFAHNNKISAAERFVYQDVRTIYADYDFEQTTGGDVVVFGTTQSQSTWPRHNELLDEFSEFSYAVALGLYDYMRKTRSSGYVVSLSGGVDSAACAYLVALMQKLSGHGALTCVYQSTKLSSEQTFAAASSVAEALGIKLIDWSVDDIVEQYTERAQKALGREFNWQHDDITLQNIQARTRGPGVWMLANALGAILLATSNRSEAALGYTTMDGDTCGGLSPIAGVNKDFLRRFLKWAETQGVPQMGPIDALSKVNALSPSAELRPIEQKDEDELMPYDIAAQIERMLLLEHRTIAEIYQAFPGRSEDVQKFLTLWPQSQWKRERYAAAFHLDNQSVDPKTWCRFPILSAGFCAAIKENS